MCRLSPERPLLCPQADNDALRGELTPETHCGKAEEEQPKDEPTEATKAKEEPVQTTDANDEPVETAEVRDEPSGSQPPVGDPAEGTETSSRATRAARRQRTRRPSRRRAKVMVTPSMMLSQDDGQQATADPAEETAAGRVTGMLPKGGDGSGDGVSRVDPGAVKEEPLEAGEPMDQGGGDGGGGDDCDGATADSSAVAPEAPDPGRGHQLADSSHDGTEFIDECRELFSGAFTKERLLPTKVMDPKHPDWNERSRSKTDWNERWRSKRMKESSLRDMYESRHLDFLKQGLLGGHLPEQPGSLPAGPAARVKVEPGTEPACSSTGAPAPGDEVAGGRAPGDSMFRVGRKVVTKQRDGSAMPAVKVISQDRRGKPKVAFVDHRTALRQAARLERIHGAPARRAGDPAAKPKPPPKRRRPPRVMVRPVEQGPSVPPADVTWMGADAQPWLAAEGAVHAVLEVQPGEEWVDAIVRSEAAAEEGGWGDGQSQMPVPLADIKAEPPE